MEAFGSAQKGSRRQAVFATSTHNDTPFSTNYFLEPPYFESITLQEFEASAMERLKVLRIFENAGFKTTKGSQEYNEFILKELTKDLRYRYVRPSAGTSEDHLADCKRRDVLSHFILRMVFSRSEEQRRWYIQQEVDLFRYRLSGEDASSVAHFLEANNFDYTPLPAEEYRNIRPILEKSTFFKHNIASADTEFYKLDFLEALDFVRKRQVFLSMGFAYVPRRHLVDVVAARFRDNLTSEIAKLSKVILDSQEDTRLLPVLAKLAVGYTGKDYSNSELDFGITSENVDHLAVESFPLCSRNMHDHFRKDHHLKHDGRLQYGLFLKGIGLSMEDALKLFRQEFTKKGVNEKAFSSQYAYNIRHMYGKEGRRVNYTPYSCMKIITTKPPNGPTEHHGCPFKHFNRSLLEQRLKSYGVSQQDATIVMELVKHGHFQVACTKYFELTHKTKLQGLQIDQIQHPNQYFEESRRLLHPETVKERPSTFSRKHVPTTTTTTTTAVVKSEPSQGNPSQEDVGVNQDFSEMDMDFPMNDDEIEAAMRAAEMELDPCPEETPAA